MLLKYFKNLLILAASAAVIVTAARLPKIAADIQDGSGDPQSQYAQMNTVRLEIREPIAPLGKLAMMGRQDGVIEIDTIYTSRTAEEIEAIAYDTLTAYIDAGLMQPAENLGICELRPLLVQVSSAPELMGVVWNVVFVEDSDAFYYVDLSIDDETGKILLIRFASSDEIPDSRQETLLRAFTDLFFCDLGIPDYADFATDDLENAYIGENACGIRYRFGDVVYGEINIDFYVYRDGFYVLFP